MILALYLGGSPEFYEFLYDFAVSNFDIRVAETATGSLKLTIDNIEPPISYSNEFTKEEAVKDFARSTFFQKFYESRFYELYRVEKIE